MTEVKNGQKVKVHYVGTFDDGNEFDNSRARQEPISFEVGSGEMIPGFDSAILGMNIGETKKIEILPLEGYGLKREELVQEVPNNAFPPDMNLEVNALVQGKDPNGNPFMARVEAINSDTVTLDFNHPMAGKKLNFEIELLEVVDQSGDEEGTDGN